MGSDQNFVHIYISQFENNIKELEMVLSRLKTEVNVNITEDDIKNDTELEIHSLYGGHLLRTLKISEIFSFLNDCQLRQDIDFVVNRKSDSFNKW